MEKFFAGVKGSIEILKPENGSFLKKHDDMVEPLSIYVDGGNMSWRYRLNYASEDKYFNFQDGLVVDFKNMPDDTRNKYLFTEKLDKIVREPWFQGRLGNIRADIAWIDMNRSVRKDSDKTDKLEQYVLERLENNLHDITTRLSGVHRAFSKDAVKINDLSSSDVKSVTKSKIR